MFNIGTGAGTLDSIPPGLYNVTCTFPTTPNVTYKFDFNCRMISIGSTFTINNVDVSTTTCNTISITPSTN